MVEDYELRRVQEDVKQLEEKNSDLKYDLDRLQKNFDELEYKLINAGLIKKDQY